MKGAEGRRQKAEGRKAEGWRLKIEN
jgi:hypothetical protein